jgi:hypothetical protein
MPNKFSRRALIQGNYDAQTGDFPPDITGITLANLTIAASAAANSAQYVSDLVVDEVTAGGVPVSA